MRPTALGQELIRFAESALSGLDRCAEDLMARQQGGYGYLSIGTIMGAAPDLVMTAVARMKAQSPQLRLRIMGDTSDQVLRLLDQTDAARNLIGLRGSPSFSGVKPVAEALDRADRGGALNTRELLTIADLLTAARRAKEYFNDEAAEKTAIDHLFLSLHGNRFLEEKIKRAIPDEDTIADAASNDRVIRVLAGLAQAAA
mgnify:CR=1 FL=1